MTAGNLMFFITIVIDSLLGFFVYVRNPGKKLNQQYALFTLSLVGWIASLFFYYFVSDHVWVLTIGRFNFAVVLLMLYFFYRFIYYFPVESIKFSKFYSWIITISTACVVLFTSFTSYVDRNELVTVTDRSTIFGDFFYIYIFSFIALIGLGVTLIILKLRESKGIFRTQLQYLLLGFVFSIILGSFTNLVLPYFFYFDKLQPVGPLSTIVFSSFVAYAIIRHKFFDIRLVVARAVTYSLLILILLSFYIVNVFLVSEYIFRGTSISNQPFIYSLLSLFIAFTFQPLKAFLEEKTDRLFFKGKYDSNAFVFRLTKIMAETIDLETLTKRTLADLLQTMRISGGAFIVLRGKDSRYQIIHQGFEQPPIYTTTIIHKFSSEKRIFIYEEEPDDEIKQIMRNNNLSVILPLFEDDQKLGVLFLGEKKSGEIYSQQDIQVLEIFGPEVSVAIQNTKSYEEINRFNLTLKDEVDKATKGLQDANMQLKQLDRLKDEFVSIASHELRTPMTSIRSYLWMALAGQGGVLTEKQRFYVQRSYSSVDRLIKLVNDMLNVSRIESGRISLEVQRVDMVELCQEVVDEVIPRGDELGVRVSVDRTFIPEIALADPDKIKEVLFNLIGNALKFTPREGSITVSFGMEDGMVETRLRDTGAGIDKDGVSKLFQKFGILPGSYTTNQELTMGTGLGLYICKSIINLHDGKIWAESEGKGYGSMFIFSLPVFSEDNVKRFHENHKDDHQEHAGLEHTQL